MQEAIILGDRQSHLMAKMMELTQERQQVLANNLSNANTPDYIRHDIDFAKQFAEMAQAEGPLDVAAVGSDIVEDHTNPSRLDGNNVQIPQEMNEMMQNGLMYDLLVKAFQTRTSILRMSMQGANS
jgi:flagellar basal-body rod protein FlgB